jgi:hypothetical protein
VTEEEQAGHGLSSEEHQTLRVPHLHRAGPHECRIVQVNKDFDVG